MIAPGEIRTHDPPSSSSDALTTEPLESLWRAGSEFTYNYTSHIYNFVYQSVSKAGCRLIEYRGGGAENYR